MNCTYLAIVLFERTRDIFMKLIFMKQPCANELKISDHSAATNRGRTESTEDWNNALILRRKHPLRPTRSHWVSDKCKIECRPIRRISFLCTDPIFLSAAQQSVYMNVIGSQNCHTSEAYSGMWNNHGPWGINKIYGSWNRLDMTVLVTCHYTCISVA